MAGNHGIQRPVEPKVPDHSGIHALTVLSTAIPVDINSLVDVAPTGMLTTPTTIPFDFDNPAGNVAHTGALPRLQQH